MEKTDLPVIAGGDYRLYRSGTQLDKDDYKSFEAGYCSDIFVFQLQCCGAKAVMSEKYYDEVIQPDKYSKKLIHKHKCENCGEALVSVEKLYRS